MRSSCPIAILFDPNTERAPFVLGPVRRAGWTPPRAAATTSRPLLNPTPRRHPWCAEDEARKQRLRHETDRRAQLAMVAEEAAARSAATREAQAVAIQIEDEVIQVS
jgi:hypothetical protein